MIENQSRKYQKNAQGQYVCPYCHITKANMNTMYYHIKKHDPDLPFACKYCDAKFVYKQYLDLHYQSKHIQIQKEVSKHACPYPNCHFHSRLETNVRTHFMRIHCKDLVEPLKSTTTCNTLFCKNCVQDYASPTAFYYHVYDCATPSVSHPSYDSYHTFRPPPMNPQEIL